MKKFSIALSALVLAIGAVAFTTNKNHKLVQYYWFSNPAGQTTAPPFVEAADEPYGCNNLATEICASAYSSFSLNSGTYTPVGSVQTTIKKHN